MTARKATAHLLHFLSGVALWVMAVCGLYFLKSLFPFSLPGVITWTVNGAICYGFYQLGKLLVKKLGYRVRE